MLIRKNFLFLLLFFSSCNKLYCAQKEVTKNLEKHNELYRCENNFWEALKCFFFRKTLSLYTRKEFMSYEKYKGLVCGIGWYPAKYKFKYVQIGLLEFSNNFIANMYYLYKAYPVFYKYLHNENLKVKECVTHVFLLFFGGLNLSLLNIVFPRIMRINFFNIFSMFVFITCGFFSNFFNGNGRDFISFSGSKEKNPIIFFGNSKNYIYYFLNLFLPEIYLDINLFSCFFFLT